MEFRERGEEKKIEEKKERKKKKLQSCLPPEKERGLIFLWVYMYARLIYKA